MNARLKNRLKAPRWFVVLSLEQMRIYAPDSTTGRLMPYASYPNETVGLRGQELARHQPGSVAEGGGGSARHIMHSGVDPADLAANAFARRMAKLLDSERKQGSFSKLVIAAGPRLMGQIKTHMSGPTLKCVDQFVTKDLGRLPDSDVHHAFSEFGHQL